MKLSLKSSLLTNVLVSLLICAATTAGERDENVPLASEDEEYWNRFLRADTIMSIGPTSGPATSPGLSECKVSVDLLCQTADGLSCDKIVPPVATCANGQPIESIALSYHDSKCEPIGNNQRSEAFCNDTQVIDFTQAVDIMCRDGEKGDPLTVDPAKVPPGGVITVTNPGGSLPKKVDCAIFDAAGAIYQQTILDASGTVPLDLKNTFGALTLESCAADQNCLQRLSYQIGIKNIGTNDIEVTAIDFTLSERSVDLLNAIAENPLVPDQATVIEATGPVDICSGGDYAAAVDVRGNPPNGNTCQDNAQYSFSLPVSAP
jgi:hypothetical protein